MKKPRILKLISSLLLISLLSVTVFSGVAFADEKNNEATTEALKKLSTMDLIHVYVERMGPYYYANYEKEDFKYFGVKTYLANNADVNLQASRTKNPGAYGVKHYLTFGIFEGRSSCSSFDAAVAIAVSK